MAQLIQVKDGWFRVIAIGGIWLLSLFANPAYKGPFTMMMVWRSLITLTSLTLAWHCNRAIVLRSRQWFGGDGSTFKRYAFMFATGLLCTGFILFCTHLVGATVTANFSAAWKEVVIDQSLSQMFRSYISGPILLFVLFAGIYEAIYNYARLQQSEKEKKALERDKAWSQLDQLNQQVNPHFLFNTLNALSSIVTENPAEADKMLNETSKVYRYLLDFNKKDLVPLREELRFIQSFFQLLQMRYGSGIALQMPPDGHEWEEYLLPPLTLQLLVENAVKHNVHSKSQPLQIVIALTEGHHLEVRNNLQRKPVKPVSHKIGLDNIAAKYRLLQQAAPVVNDDGHFFIVKVKLISPSEQLTHLRPSAI
jgi:two-component system, LytTR family, sensor kinase